MAVTERLHTVSIGIALREITSECSTIRHHAHCIVHYVSDLVEKGAISKENGEAIMKMAHSVRESVGRICV